MPDAQLEQEKLSLERKMGGVSRLRDHRGSEEVKFDQVADHLIDFAARHPDHVPVIDQFASFLTDVENRDHDHDAEGGSAGG